MITYMKLISGEEIVARVILTASADSVIITMPFKFYYFMDVPGSMSWRLVRWLPVRSMMQTPQAIDRSSIILISAAESPLTELFGQHEALVLESLKKSELKATDEAVSQPTANTMSGSAPTDPDSKNHYLNILESWKPPEEVN